MKITKKFVKKVIAKAYEAYAEKVTPPPPSILTDRVLLSSLRALIQIVIQNQCEAYRRTTGEEPGTPLPVYERV